PDGYYLSINQFDELPGGSETYAGAGAVVFERDRMLAGQAARMVYFDLFSVNPAFGSMLPSDANGTTRPPAGSPNYFVEVDDDASGWPTDRLQVFEFHVDWNDTNASTFTGPAVLDTAPFTALCPTPASCIPQPGTAQRLDAIGDRVMNRLQYRNFGDHETLVTNHTVDADGSGHAGVRWYELRRGGGAWAIYQQGTYAPDGDHRWMASAAMDRGGNLAVGYSVASAATFPSVRYAGRLATDPLGTLAQSETTLVAGGGAQTGSTRWGDYSMLAIDPVDDCTFWYTQEYYASSSASAWRTRIGA